MPARTATRSSARPAGSARRSSTTAARSSASAGAKAAGKTAAKSSKKPSLHISMLKPSVNNMAVRVFARAAGLDFAETDVWGSTRSPEFLAKNPAHMTPMLEDKALPNGCLWESCAIMQYLSNKHGLDNFYPSSPAKRAMIDSAMFYLIGTLYPYVARATYPTLNFPQYAGEVGASSANPARKLEAAKAAREALSEPLEVFRSFYLKDKPFIGGSRPSIADIRLAA